MNKILSAIYDWFVLKLIANITWTGLKKLLTGRDFDLSLEDRRSICIPLYTNNALVLSRRKAHLTTYFIGVSNYFLTGTWGYWSHAFFNVEGEAASRHDLLFVEAIGKGVVENDIVEVLNADCAVVLVPMMYGLNPLLTTGWDKAVQNVKSDIGKAYDSRFNLDDSSKVSCVELILDQLREIPDYDLHFPGLLALICKCKNNLTPDMLYKCGDFKVLVEIRH